MQESAGGPILGQLLSVRTLTGYLSKIHQPLKFPNGLSALGFPNKISFAFMILRMLGSVLPFNFGNPNKNFVGYIL
jgi:hypothetical protein